MVFLKYSFFNYHLDELIYKISDGH